MVMDTGGKMMMILEERRQFYLLTSYKLEPLKKKTFLCLAGGEWNIRTQVNPGEGLLSIYCTISCQAPCTRTNIASRSWFGFQNNYSFNIWKNRMEQTLTISPVTTVAEG